MRRILICVLLAFVLMLSAGAEEVAVETVVPIGGVAIGGVVEEVAQPTEEMAQPPEEDAEDMTLSGAEDVMPPIEQETDDDGVLEDDVEGDGSFAQGIVGFFTGFGDYTVEDWEAFIETSVMPVVVMIVTAVASIYIAISPVLYKVKTASQRFHKASDHVEAATGEVADIKKMTAEAAASFEARYQLIEKECNELRREVATMLADVSRSLAEQYAAFRAETDGKVEDTRALAERIESMLVVAFCNDKNLVERGQAHEIARIAQGLADGEEVSGHGEEVGGAE